MRKILVVLALFFVIACAPKSQIGPVGGIHAHADYKVFLEGNEFDFAKREYMVKEQYVHIENMVGDEIHAHATGVTMGEFFRTLGWKFTSECIKTDAGKEYCNEGENTLKFYVNSEPNELYGDYLIGDKDKILISYGSESEEEIQAQLDTVGHSDHSESEEHTH